MQTQVYIYKNFMELEGATAPNLMIYLVPSLLMILCSSAS